MRGRMRSWASRKGHSPPGIDRFRWTGFTDATWYYLQVQTASGEAVFGRWYTSAEAGCGGGTGCGVTPSEVARLENGAYQWRILDYGEYGYGQWTAFQGFTLNTAPVNVVLGEPVGTETEWDRSFRWTGLAGATYYYLEVQKADGTYDVRCLVYECGGRL